MRLILDQTDLNQTGLKIYKEKGVSLLSMEHFTINWSTIYQASRITFEDAGNVRVLKCRELGYYA